MFGKRLMEKYEWKFQEAKAEHLEKYNKKLKEKEDTFAKALEIQQSIYDKKLRQLEELAKTAYQKGRNEVLDMVKEKINSGEITYKKHT